MFVALVELICGTCGVVHAIPKAMHDRCVEEGGFWHCPNGHSRGYREGKHEREKVERERNQLKQENARLQTMLSAAVHNRVQAEKSLTKLRRRTHAGVCPCCKRTFANVARHMKIKHPNVAVLEANG